MNSLADRMQMVGHRGELMIELFLQDLEPGFVAQSTSDFGYDFFVGFTNADGGINTSAVVAKATEQPVSDRYCLPKNIYAQLAYSNIPVLLLVANVKENRLYHAWIKPQDSTDGANGTISIPVVEIDQEAQQSIRQRLAE
ncbi:MAG: DUF4365 domain-containing protein [Symploca sp. SIO2E6]|nr:DUF4365 domain-containing protein [Symploca sp. SIO2E6]